MRRPRGSRTAMILWPPICALSGYALVMGRVCANHHFFCSHPQASHNTSADCQYSCTELTVYFKIRLAIEASSLPSCTILLIDQPPSGTLFSVNTSDNHVILGTPEVVNFGRRIDVAPAHVALRYIRMSHLATSGSGGAVIAHGSTITLHDCIFDNNTASSAGGAVFASQSILTVERTAFRSNRANRGGAIALFDSTIIVHTTTFQLNNATLDGGALHANMTMTLSAASVNLHYTQFSNNNAGDTNAGDSVYLLGVTRWLAVNVSYNPFDPLRSVETQGTALLSCTEPGDSACDPGYSCTHGLATLRCSPCQNHRTCSFLASNSCCHDIRRCRASVSIH